MNTPLTPINVEKTPWRLGRLALALAGVVLLLLIFSLSIIESGQQGVVTRSGSDQVRVLDAPGLYMHLPFIERVWVVDTRLQTSEQDQLSSYTTVDGQSLRLSGWLAWRVIDPVLFNQATQTGKSPVDARVLNALSDSFAAQLAMLPAATLRTSPDLARLNNGLPQINQTLASLGIRAEQLGVRQMMLSEAETQATFTRMGAVRTQASRQMLAGLVADAQKLVSEQDRRGAQVLADAYRSAQQTRQQADKRLQAAYARQYGAAVSLSDALQAASASENTAAKTPETTQENTPGASQ